MEVRYGGQGTSLETVVERLEQAVRLDASNERAGRLLEHIYRGSSRWEELARVLGRLAEKVMGVAHDELIERRGRSHQHGAGASTAAPRAARALPGGGDCSGIARHHHGVE